jgi:cytochrome b pre-mRNA-processing protein 3
MVLAGFLRRRRLDRAGLELYATAVRAARDPGFYAAPSLGESLGVGVGSGVPDTVDGRFDMIGLHVALLIQRLRALAEPGPALAPAVFDAMFSDMDTSLREMGVSDLSVGKRVKAMWDAFHGRAGAYEAALAAGDQAALADALSRNVWRGAAPAGAADCLAAHTVALVAHLATQGLDRLAGGQVSFLPAPACTGKAP